MRNQKNKTKEHFFAIPALPAGRWSLPFTICLLLFAILLLVPQARALAATYYLDAVNGNDSNPTPTTWATAKKTFSGISTLLDALADDGAGDVVEVNDGNYGLWGTALLKRNRTDWLTFRAATGKSPVITAVALDAGGVDIGNVYLIFDGFTIDYTTVQASPYQKGGMLFRDCDYVQVKNCTLIGPGWNYATGGGSSRVGIYLWNNIVAPHTYHVNYTIDNCTFKGPTAGRLKGWGTAIYAKLVDGLTVQNSNISQCGVVLYPGGKNITFTRNTVHDIGMDGIVYGNGNNLTISYNTFYDIGIVKPTLTETVTDTVWSNNGTIMTNPNAHWKTAGDTLITTNMELYTYSGYNVRLGDSWVGTWNPEVEILSVDSDTQITLSGSAKLDPALGEPSNVNYIIRPQTHSDVIQTWTDSNNVTISNNQIYNTLDAWAFMHIEVGGHNCLIENNLCWNDYPNVGDENGSPLNIRLSSNLTFRNNIVIGRLCIDNNNDYAVTFSNNVVSYAQFWSVLNSNSDYNILNRTDGTVPGAHTTVFNEGINEDKWDDPAFFAIFADPNNGNFQHASASSLGVGHSDPANSPSVDILGNLRDAQPDAGCYEYGVSTFLYGDVNGDGEISAYDAALAAHIAVDLEHPDIKNRAAADVNGDSEVTAYDAALIAQYAVGLIDKFPVEE